MNTLELTIQRKTDSGYPVVAALARAGGLLPLRRERMLNLDTASLAELQYDPLAYGTALGQALFVDEIRDTFVKVLGDEPLRVLLSIEAPDLRILDWHRLAAPFDGRWRFLASQQNTPFSLSVPSPASVHFPALGRRDLRALVLVAGPESLSGDYKLAPFDVPATFASIQAALGDIPCDILPNPSLDILCAALTATPYTILHLVCHGAVNQGGETILYFPKDSKGGPTTASDLLNRLGSLAGLPHFVFISACESALPQNGLGSLAGRLVRELGLPAVLAMTDRVSIATAGAIAKPFYTHLYQHGQPDLALAQSLAGTQGVHDLTVPAIFSRLGDRPLFDDNSEIALGGYENWRSAQNGWFIERCKSEKKSRAAFGQVLNVADNRIHLINRSELLKQLDQWFCDWGQTHAACVLEGEEGDGKTWTIASWLSEKVKSAPNFPAILFLPSFAASSDIPEKLLVDLIRQQVKVTDDDDVMLLQVKQWVTKPPTNTPSIILILDGINEHYAPKWWRSLLEKFSVSPWNAHIGLIITCRTIYWDRNFRELAYFQPQIFSVPTYNNDELSKALKQHKLTLSNIPHSVIPLLRKPRYFDLMVRHRVRMAESGDITSARLVYEDWRDRYERKTNIPLSNDDFRDVILNIAQKNRGGRNDILPDELAAILPLYEEKQNITQELLTGGIIQNIGGKYRVAPKLLQYGFGLLLAEEVSKACSKPDVNLDEIIASWLEPQPEMDIKSAICDIAVLHAMTANGYPSNGQISLLKWWVSIQNPPQEVEESFVAYLPLNPKAYFALAEIIWGNESDNIWAKELIVRSLMKWRHAEKVTKQLTSVFEKWLGFIYRDGHLSRYRDDQAEEKVRQERAKLTGRVGYELVPGEINIVGYPLTVIEQSGLLDLGNVALAVISHMTRNPYIHAIAIGCVAEAVVDNPEKYDLFKWVLRSAQSSISDQVIQEAQFLIAQNTTISLQAAYRLLNCEGGPDAIKLRQTLRQDLFPPHPFIDKYENDPCGSGFSWKRSHVEPCLERKDLEVKWVARQLKKFCIDPNLRLPKEWVDRLPSVVDKINPESLWKYMAPTAEQHSLGEVEPALCAFSPSTLEQFIRTTIQFAKKRSGLELRQFIFAIRQYMPLFGPDEREALLELWWVLQDPTTPWTEMREDAEWALFPLILQFETNGDRQLQFLVKRHPSAHELLTFERLFRPVVNLDIVLDMLKNDQDIKLLQRVLWFVSSSENSFHHEILLAISDLLNHEDSIVRLYAMKILWYVGDSTYLASFIRGQWTYGHKANSPIEDHWGSLLLSRFGTFLPYKELRNRIQPQFLGYAVTQRGAIPEEVAQFASNVLQMWKYASEGKELPVNFPIIELNRPRKEDITVFNRFHITDDDINNFATSAGRNVYWGDEKVDFNKFSDLSSDEYYQTHQKKLREIVNDVIQKQSKEGNALFHRIFPLDGLENAMMQCPDVFNTIIEAVLAEGLNSSRTLALCQGLYETLCGILVKQRSPNGVKLYKKLTESVSLRIIDQKTHIRCLDFLLFSGQEEVSLIAEWENLLMQCATNIDLLELVIIATSGSGKEWLKSRIDSGLQSTIQLERARAIVLLGFLDDDIEHLIQKELISDLDTWVNKVAEDSLQQWKKNNWAKTWFKHFLTDEDDTKAWAAFRLFLECVDRRFDLWKQEIINSSFVKTKGFDRLMFLESLEDAIDNKIKHNEEPIRESFLSHKVLKRKACPWMIIMD